RRRRSSASVPRRSSGGSSPSSSPAASSTSGRRRRTTSSCTRPTPTVPSIRRSRSPPRRAPFRVTRRPRARSARATPPGWTPAAPGDGTPLADGVCAGPFVLDASGTAANPIVLRGTSIDGTVLDGGDCDSCNVLEVYGSDVHVERLTLRHANRALRFQTAGAVGNVVRRVHARDVRLGFGSREDQRDFYLCDNALEGRLLWPHVYFDDGG